MDRQRADPVHIKEAAESVEQQLRYQCQIAEVHDADVQPPDGDQRLPETEARNQQRSQRQRRRPGEDRWQQAFEDHRQGQQLDRIVEWRGAQDLDLEHALHELRQRPLKHDEEGDPEETQGHAPADGKGRGIEQQVLGDQEERECDEEEAVVHPVAVVLTVRDQRAQQHGHDGDEKEVVGQQEQRPRQVAGEPHSESLQQPGGHQHHQCRAVIAADVNPVLGGGEQKASEHRPAEAEEHLVGVPLRRREWRCRSRQRAGEDQRPDNGQQGAGDAGQREEGPEADQPERVLHRKHGEMAANGGEKQRAV